MIVQVDIYVDKTCLVLFIRLVSVLVAIDLWLEGFGRRGDTGPKTVANGGVLQTSSNLG